MRPLPPKGAMSRDAAGREPSTHEHEAEAFRQGKHPVMVIRFTLMLRVAGQHRSAGAWKAKTHEHGSIGGDSIPKWILTGTHVASVANRRSYS
jgi:hypothetical protein